MERENRNLIYVKAGAFEFRIDPAEIATADIVAAAQGAYHIIYNGVSMTVHIGNVSQGGKTLVATADGEVFPVQIRDGLDQMLDTMGFTGSVARVVKEIRAPMPGLVLAIDVQEEDELEEGQRILILEAMKMENSIVMHAAGRVKKVNVKKGQAVEKNQVLVELH